MHPSKPLHTQYQRIAAAPLERMRKLNTPRQHLDRESMFGAHCASSECDATTAESEVQRTGHDKS